MEKAKYKLSVPGLTINDAPRFQWRGVHLDVGRHLYKVEDIKKYIDYLAMHKMRQFHWHLTEDQGWRIEIKKYPKLTSIGAWRNETMGDGKKYGGYYTQEEIKDIVRYADSRFIEVIPEIELPGHSVAALAAYPEFSCTGGPFEVATTWGVHSDVYCAGNEKTFKFLEDVLNEVIPLFPSKYIHIGGDECPKTRWEECQRCQRRIKNEGLKDEHELQSYFIQRIEKFLLTKNRQIIGWDEILEGGLAPQATVMSWRGIQGGIEAAKQGHDVIMTPGSHCYFDHHQGDPAFEPHAFGNRLTLTKVYSYEPIPEELTADEEKYVLGAQANVWTERLQTFKDVEYMLMPRLAAISEVVWSPKKIRNNSKFVKKMETQLQRYDYLDINYATSAYNATISTEFNEQTNTLDITMNSELGNTSIYYTTDGSVPNNESNKYTGRLKINESTTVKAVSYKDERRMSNVTEKKISVHKAFGKKIEIVNPYAERYSSGGKYSVVNGLF
ncbi:MAG: family 20 glycosylhydrolase, partial [Melioribacteraceae bacterium]|nr:family 20 glycosylhydrolase [Melioribacteraceae bacterium]